MVRSAPPAPACTSSRCRRSDDAAASGRLGLGWASPALRCGLLAAGLGDDALASARARSASTCHKFVHVGRAHVLDEVAPRHLDRYGFGRGSAACVADQDRLLCHESSPFSRGSSPRGRAATREVVPQACLRVDGSGAIGDAREPFEFLEAMLRLDPAHGARTRAHDQRMGRRTVGPVPHPAQQ